MIDVCAKFVTYIVMEY